MGGRLGEECDPSAVDACAMTEETCITADDGSGVETSTCQCDTDAGYEKKCEDSTGEGPTTTSNTTTATTTAKPSLLPFPWWIILIIVLAVVFLLIAGIVILWRCWCIKKSKQPKTERSPLTEE